MYKLFKTELRYTWLNKYLNDLSKEEIIEYVQNFHHDLNEDLWFTMLENCKYTNHSVFVPFFIELSIIFPKKIVEHMTYFSWYHYVEVLKYLIETNKNELLAKKIIQILITQLYEEKYNDRTITSLGYTMPRERKSLDRDTHIAKTLAYNYYTLYLERNKENEWEDVAFLEQKKGTALKLYRQDCAYLTQKYKENIV